MKAVTVLFVTALGLMGCHADRTMQTSSTGPAPTTSAAAPKTDKSFEKSRDAMLGNKTDADGQHWGANPAAATTSAPPASVPDKPAPSGTSNSPAASSTTGIN